MSHAVLASAPSVSDRERAARRGASRVCAERAIESVLFLAALVSVITTVGIVYMLVMESVAVLPRGVDRRS